MSVVTTTSSISYNGNNSTTVFAYNFRILAESDLVVKVGGVVKTLTTHYTVSGVGAASGGNVTFTAGNTPPTGTKNVAFTRSVTNTQATDYQDGDKLSADVIEADFDRRTMQSQEIENELNAVVLKVPVEHTAASFSGLLPDPGLAASRSKVININAAGTGLELSVLTLGTLAPQNANSVDIDGGAIDGTVIGGSSAAAGTFTTLTASTLGGALNVNNENLTNVDIDSGAIDGTTIGGASAAAGTFTTATATTKVVTPEVEMSGSTLLVDAASGTLDVDATTLDVDATTTCEIDNANTTNGVKLGTNTSGGKVYLGHTTSETTVNDNLTVTGDLTVNGTTITANATTITVDDKNIELGSVASPSDATADGGGITLKGGTDKTLIWDNANDNWTSNQHLNISTGKEFKINNTKVLDATSLGSAVVGTSITSTGTIASGTWQGTAVAPQYGGTGQNFSSSTGAIQVSSGTVSAGTLPVSMGGSGQTSYTNGQLLIGNTTGNTLAKGTLTAGTGISVTNAGGSITIANTGNSAQGDMNGDELVLDTDGDTSLHAENDDQIDVKISGADDFQFTANNFTALSGSDVTLTGASYNAVWDSSDNALEFADNAKANFGVGDDLSIYHDGSHSYITDGGTGNLKITASQLDILGTSETMATFVDDGAVTLYHNNITKIATTAAGATITGTLVATTDTDTSNTGSVTLDFTANQNFVLTFTGNVTLANPSTEQVGQSGVICCIQDGTGSRTLSLGTDYETAGGAGITLSTAANAVDIIPYFVKAANSIQLGAVQQAFS